MDTSNRILRLPEVMEKTGVRRSSVYAWMKDGSFPKQIKMGMRASGWIEREIDEWIERRASGRF
jgi:prophage regulatory protein